MQVIATQQKKIIIRKTWREELEADLEELGFLLNALELGENPMLASRIRS